MGSSNRFLHDPDAVLDYCINWSAWLPTGDTIVGATWAVPDGLTGASPIHSTTTATIWLSGGQPGLSYHVTCHIETAAGREDDRSIVLVVRQR